MTNVKDFWDAQAKQLGSSQQATNEDVWYRSLEINEIIKQLAPDPGYVLDVGCGNGYSTKKFAARFPHSFFEGMDFSEPMISEARRFAATNTIFFNGDILQTIKPEYKFGRGYGVVVSERCLINLSCVDQETAILQMKNVLHPTGKLILVENTMDGLNRLNSMRERIGLPPILVRWHNTYFLHKLLVEFLQEHFEHVECHNIGTPYYLLSRVVYAKYAQIRGIEPDYNNLMNRIACRIPPIKWWWASPNMMYVCTGKKA